jgi:hypothetical protein
VNNKYHQVVEQVPIVIINHQGSNKQIYYFLMKTIFSSSPHRSSLNVIDTNHQRVIHEANSSDTDLPTRTSTNYKHEHTSSTDKRQKSSSTVDENDKRRSSFQRRSGQQSKRNSNLITDETIVTPIIMDSSKIRQQNGKVNYSLLFF